MTALWSPHTLCIKFCLQSLGSPGPPENSRADRDHWSTEFLSAPRADHLRLAPLTWRSHQRVIYLMTGQTQDKRVKTSMQAAQWWQHPANGKKPRYGHPSDIRFFPSVDGILSVEEWQGSFFRREKCTKLYLSIYQVCFGVVVVFLVTDLWISSRLIMIFCNLVSDPCYVKCIMLYLSTF